MTAVDRDEPLFEISTDKVDAEIPAPAAGVLAEILAKEGETVPVDSVVAVIAEAGAAVAAPQPVAPVSAPVPAPPQVAAGPVRRTASAAPAGAPVAPAPTRPAAPTPPASAAPAVEELRRQRSSPLVRRIAREHNIDIAELAGFRRRRTRDEAGHPGLHRCRSRRARPRRSRKCEASAPAHAAPRFEPGEAVEIVPMTVMRKRIAEHMIASRRTSAHVHSVFEVDFLRVTKIRDAKKAEYERLGVKLTYLPFIIKAACRCA